jgi:hypothetical protein
MSLRTHRAEVAMVLKYGFPGMLGGFLTAALLWRFSSPLALAAMPLGGSLTMSLVAMAEIVSVSRPVQHRASNAGEGPVRSAVRVAQDPEQAFRPGTRRKLTGS